MHFLVYLDEQRCDDQITSFAALLAKKMDAELTLLYVLGRGENKAEGKARLEQAAKQTEGIPTEVLLRWGETVGVLLSEAGHEKFDLIILRSRNGDQPMSLVPFDKIISQSIFPSVLVLRGGEPVIENVLICTGGLEGHNVVLEAGSELAQALSARVTLTHVAPGSIPSMYTGLQMDESLEELLQTDTPIARHLRTGAQILNEHDVDGELQLRRGVPIDEILREVRLGEYDLIVIGRSKSPEGLKSLMLGDATQQVLTQVTIPVLVVGESGLSGSKQEGDSADHAES